MSEQKFYKYWTSPIIFEINDVFMMQVYWFSPILSIKMLLKASVSPSPSRVVCCCYFILHLSLVVLEDNDDDIDVDDDDNNDVDDDNTDVKFFEDIVEK